MTSPDAVDVLGRLRLETRAEHDAIESLLGLADENLTREAYVGTLLRFFEFYRVVEQELEAVDQHEALGIDLGPRRKTPLLRADLSSLGVPSAATPGCNPPALTCAADALGCLYVLEGATLGGQVISKHVRACLRITPETGGRFFHGYGDQTGAMWTEFREAARSFAAAHPAAPDSMVAAARATFRSLREWCAAAHGATTRVMR